MNSKELPRIKVRSYGKRPLPTLDEKSKLTNREYIRQIAKQKNETFEYRVDQAKNPLLDKNSDFLTIKLEELSLDEASIPTTLRSFIDLAIKHFQEVAVTEGLIESETQINFRIKFVDTNDWNAIYREKTYAIHSCQTNSIYLKIDTNRELDAHDLLEITINIFHEMRHRIGGRTVEYLYDEKVFPYDVRFEKVRVNLNTFSSAKYPDGIFEEIFTAGYIAKNFEKILKEFGDKDLLAAWKIRSEQLSPKFNIPGSETVMSTRRNDITIEFFICTYFNFLSMFAFLEDRVPDFNQHLIEIRGGKKLSRNRLARAIIGAFDKKTLKMLLATQSLDELSLIESRLILAEILNEFKKRTENLNNQNK